jgi:heat shock protein HslJ
VARWLLPLVLLALLPAAPASAADNPLAGPTWRVTRVEGKVVKRSAHQRLLFSHRRTFTLRGGTCGNDFRGRYGVTTARLRFRVVVVTGGGCDGSAPEPPNVAEVLDRTRGYRISGHKLELLGRRGRTLAVLKRRG